MASIGFPGINEFRKRAVRGPVNPLDKATVVSIYPKRIDEVKHTIQPGRFIVEPGSYDTPAVLVVGSSSWWRELDQDQPLLEIPVSSIQIADSIVRDFSSGLLACNMGDMMPGLFYLPGEHTVVDIKENHKPRLEQVAAWQKKYYSELVKIADSLWARSNGNPLAISDDMRMAARELGLLTKDWLKDFTAVEMVRCFACGALKNPLYPVCATCRAIDPAHAQSKNIKFSA